MCSKYKFFLRQRNSVGNSQPWFKYFFFFKWSLYEIFSFWSFTQICFSHSPEYPKGATSIFMKMREYSN
jgi:hypothetical protein